MREKISKICEVSEVIVFSLVVLGNVKIPVYWLRALIIRKSILLTTGPK